MFLRGILSEFPEVLKQVSYEVGKQKQQFRLSPESPVDNPALTISSFNKQFQLNKQEKEAVELGMNVPLYFLRTNYFSPSLFSFGLLSFFL